MSLLAIFLTVGTLIKSNAQPVVKLRNIEAAPGAGYTLYTDANGKLYYIVSANGAVTVNLTPIAYVPAATGNPSNNNQVVTDPNGDVWIIDDSGNGLKIDEVIDGSETKITAGTNITISGSGTAGDPFVINSTSSGSGSISDEAYGATWDGNTTEGASKNAIYDQMQTIIGGAADGDGILDGDGTVPSDTDVGITDSLMLGTIQILPNGVIKQVLSINNSIVQSGDTLALKSDLPTWSTLSGIPVNIDTDDTDDFSGSFNDLTDVPAGFSDGTDNVDDADADPLNEIQTLDSLLLSGTTLIADADADPLNEIQTLDSLLLSGTTLIAALSDDGVAPKMVDLSSLQDGTGTDDQNASEVSLTDTPGDWGSANLEALAAEIADTTQAHRLAIDGLVAGGSDNWGVQVVETDATLTGDGTTGTELSVANPFTDADETKLDGIAAGAEVNVNADWNAVSGDAQILNKPTISGTNTGDEPSATTAIEGVIELATEAEALAGTLGTRAVTPLAMEKLIPKYTSTSISGGTLTLDCGSDYSHTFEIANSGNTACTLTINNEIQAGYYMFHLKGMSAATNITFPSECKDMNGTGIGTISVSTSATVTCYGDGTDLNCRAVID